MSASPPPTTRKGEDGEQKHNPCVSRRPNVPSPRRPVSCGNAPTRPGSHRLQSRERKLSTCTALLRQILRLSHAPEQQRASDTSSDTREAPPDEEIRTPRGASEKELDRDPQNSAPQANRNPEANDESGCHADIESARGTKGGDQNDSRKESGLFPQYTRDLVQEERCIFEEDIPGVRGPCLCSQFPNP